MSIETRENTPEKKIASTNSELGLFTDRKESICLFASYLHQYPTPEEILFFYGDGGNGKTLLLKYLRKKCCKLFPDDTWQEITTLSKAEAADLIANTPERYKFIPIPAIIHNFGQASRDDQLPQDPLYGPRMLRRSLAQKAKDCGYRLSFPLFDFAIFWYFRKIGKSDEEIKNSFSSDEVGLVAQLIDGIAGIPWVGLATASLEILAKYLGLPEMLKKRGIDSDKAIKIQTMDAEPELIDYLPEYLAQDLNAAMTETQAPPRLVLFFDTHENFWGIEGNLQVKKFFPKDQKDRWLRHFLRFLDLDKGIIAVVAGRKQPKWPEATDKYKIPEKYINIQLVGYLSAADARVYLNKAGIITREELAKAIIDYASVSSDQIHPFLLNLCVDVVTSAEGKVALTPADFLSQARAEDKPEELFARLLIYADGLKNAVEALCASRGFNYQIYKHLGQASDLFTAKRPDFDILTEFSFVWQDEKHGEEWYRIHDLLRRLYRENPKETTQRAHSILEAYWRKQGNISEAIYHAICLDWEKGLTEWVEVFEEALRLSRYYLCRALLEVRSELNIGSYEWLGYISASEGNYFAQLARHAEAEAEFTEAIAAYEKALTLAPDDIGALNSKGIALTRLGKLQAVLAQHLEALDSYRSAIAAYDQALTLAPDDIGVLNNKGMALRSLGKLQAGLTQHPEALDSYRSAIAAYDQALTLPPDDISVLNNKGMALQSLGELQAGLAQHPEALDSYRSAIAASDQALTLAPDDIGALNIKGIALRSLGTLQAGLAQHPEALDSYRSAIAAYDQALTLAPDDIGTLNNKGTALKSLGVSQARLAQHSEALDSYRSAIAAYDQALAIAPDDINALNNKGLALISLGNLYSELSMDEEAIKNWQTARSTLSQSLKIAPKDTYIQNWYDELDTFHELPQLS